MKKLFNNPWFVAALGAFAMIYLGFSVVKPLFQDDSVDTDYSMVDPLGLADFEEEVAAAVTGRRTGQSANRDEIGWLQNRTRDPFSDTLLAEEFGTVQTLPKVEALFVGAGVQAAVINNRLVRVGDVVDRFRVVDIAAQRVQVSLDGKTYFLEPDV